MLVRNFLKIVKNKAIFQVPFVNITSLGSYNNRSTIKPFYKITAYFFVGGKKPGDKKGKLKAEKETIVKEFDGLSEEDLKQKYIDKSNVWN
jgi:hypothetical protein